MERSRGGGGRRRDRSRPPDALPQPRAIVREVRALRASLAIFAEVYALEHEALVALGGSDVHVQTGPSDSTVSTLLDGENEAARRRCARAVAHLRSASKHVEMALAAFGPLAEQPTTTSADAVVSQSTFDKARHQHYEREKGLRVD